MAHRLTVEQRERPLNFYLPDEIDQRTFVLIPHCDQFFPRWKFPTAEFKRQFKAVARQVIEILHAATHGIPIETIVDNAEQPIGISLLPSCTVGDPIAKHVGRAGLALQGHCRMTF